MVRRILRISEDVMLKTWSIAALLTLFGLCAHSPPAQAWGRFGHLVVCDLAYRNLTDASKEKLKQLFNDKKGITVTGEDGKKRHYTSFNLGCLEEDATPRRHPDDHFINVGRDTKSIDGKLCPHNATCIFAGIERDLKILKDDPSREKRVLALMAVGHWIGDIHQPLHISFADDRGGNWINVKLQGKCGTSGFGASNLHAVWDNCLLDAGLFERVRQGAAFKQAKKKWGPNTITYRAVDTLLAETSLTEEKSLVASQPWEWAAESYAITLRPEVLYCEQVGQSCQYTATMPVLPALPKTSSKAAREAAKRAHEAAMITKTIDQAYLKSFERVAEERAKKAGFRLAHLLNQALDPAYKEPLQNSTQKP
jgi:S1/P1 Nuclease